MLCSPRATSSPTFPLHSWTSVSRLRILNLRFYGNRGEEGMFIMEQVCKTPTFHQFNQVYSPLYLTIIAIDGTQPTFFPI